MLIISNNAESLLTVSNLSICALGESGTDVGKQELAFEVNWPL